MNKIISVNFPCNHCKKEVEIEVEIESPSDYYFGCNCPECHEFLNVRALDTKIYEAIINYYAGMADYYKDE